jgi:SAM-dependent methyltransferase
MQSWIDFWNSDHSIYVNERHKQLHAEHIAADIIRYIRRPEAVVLDHGCGEALYAKELRTKCGHLILCEPAPKIHNALVQRWAASPAVTVIDPAGLHKVATNSLDLIVVNSVVQYLSRAQLTEVLELWRDRLKPSGELIIADVIPPNLNPLRDSAALIGFSARGGFLWPALGGLVRTALSDYRTIRKNLGFSMFTETGMIELLAAHGLMARRVHPNFGHNQARMTFQAQRTRSP